MKNSFELSSVSICCAPAIFSEIALHLTSAHSIGYISVPKHSRNDLNMSFCLEM